MERIGIIDSRIPVQRESFQAIEVLESGTEMVSSEFNDMVYRTLAVEQPCIELPLLYSSASCLVI
jgi:hypothetical protein